MKASAASVNRVGSGKVICALSGGVDSSVVAVLIHRAIGDQLTCIFVDHGLMRKEEVKRTFNTFRLNLGMNIILVEAADRFLKKLKGVTDPEVKAKNHRRGIYPGLRRGSPQNRQG